MPSCIVALLILFFMMGSGSVPRPLDPHAWTWPSTMFHERSESAPELSVMITFGNRFRNVFARINNFVIYQVLRASDSAHRLALGLAVAVFVTWTPTIGFQMMLVLLLAPLVRANARVGLPVVWLSNPFTLVPIYYPNYVLGRFLVGLASGRTADRPGFEETEAALSRIPKLRLLIENLFDLEMWQQIGEALLILGVDLWVGSIAMGLILGALTYVASYYAIIRYRRRHPANLAGPEPSGDAGPPSEAQQNGDLY